MKKLSLTAVFCLVLITIFTNVCFADEGVIECPYIKIIIDGKLTTYDVVTIAVNGRTLLPLRATLNNLGVKDENIDWNNASKSVTITKGTQKIVLTQGNNTAYVNGNAITLDVAPVAYNSTGPYGYTYIPTRFIAQTLGKKVVWDGASKSVLIRNEEAFNGTKAILSKCVAAMKNVSRGKLGVKMAAAVQGNSLNTNVSALATGMVDTKKRLIYNEMKISVMGNNISTGTYLAGNNQYILNPTSNKWDKQALTKEQFDEVYGENDLASFFNDGDTLSAGLILGQSTNENELILEGDVFLDTLADKVSTYNVNYGKIAFKKFHMLISYDRNVNLIYRIHMEFESDTDSSGHISLNADINYSDYNANFEIAAPDGI